MTDQPPIARRSPDEKSEDDQPTLVLPLGGVGKSQYSETAKESNEGKAHGGGPEPSPNSTEKSKIGRLKKFFTSSPSRKAASIIGAILLAAFSGIAGVVAPDLFSNAQKVGGSETQHIFFVPWSGSGNLSEGLHVASSVNGYCWTSSSVSMRYDAYRCFGPNSNIYDPCFESGPQGSVACPMPSPANVTVIRLVKALPKTSRSQSTINSSSPPDSTVWLVVLADGDRCYAINAASDDPGGMSLTYACKDGNLYGELNASRATWTIWEQKAGGADMTLAPVAQAYSLYNG